MQDVTMQDVTMQDVKFNNDALVMALDIRRKASGLNWAEVAGATGVSASTICRIRAGKNPDADSLARMVCWCGVDFNHLIARGGRNAGTRKVNG